MQNIQNNRISYEISEQKKQKINDLLNQLESELDFTVALTNDERQKLPKINKDNKLFVQDAVVITGESENILPTYISPKETARDLNLYEDLEPFILRSENIFYKLRDTQMLAGSEAYTSALMIYKMYKAAASAGISGAQANYNNLRERFARQQSSTETDVKTKADLT